MYFRIYGGCCVVLLAFLARCAPNVPIPEFGEESLLPQSDKVPEGRLALLESMVTVQAQTDLKSLLGQTVVVAARSGGVSFFSGTDVYAVTRAGCLDEGRSLVLEGHWREAHTTRTGLIQLFVEPSQWAEALCDQSADPPDPATLRFSGWMRELGEEGQQDVELLYRQPPKPHDDFFVVAHRAGCRTSDDCGASENSVEMIRIAESFGADAIEVDAIATADGVPVLYHDLAFSARLVRGTYCYGPVSEFTLAHVKALCTLEHGEEVPTLAEALRTTIDETTLGGVWIDIKDARSVPAIIEVTEAARAYAASVGRSVTLLYGLYSDETIEAYLAANPPDSARCLVETSAKDAITTGCQVWAPRWTRGTMVDKVAQAHDNGLLVGYWTVDEREFIDHFLLDARPNALLTNRPWLVHHRYQTLGKSPLGPEELPFP